MTRVVAVCALVLCGGCAGYGVGGKPVAVYKPGGAADTSRVPFRATYALYRAENDVPKELVYLRDVADGKPIGFTHTVYGELAAVADAAEVPVPEGSYRWHVAPADAKQTALDRGLSTVAGAYMGVTTPVAETVGETLKWPLFAVGHVLWWIAPR